MRSWLIRILLATAAFSWFFLSAPHAFAQSSPFRNLNDIANTLNITTYASARPTGRIIRLAILDNGFRDQAAQIGQTLPSGTIYHPGPVAVDPAAEEAHGLFMAQLVSGLLAKTGLPYELHLFSAFGYSNLKQAVETVIEQKFDVVLYSQVWEYGGNGDGRGFIDALVSKATNAGIVWVNAAGNFGDATYQAGIERGADDWAVLPGPNSSVRVRCLDNPKKKCGLRAILSWNDFKDDVNLGTDKDLDLVLTDDTLKIIRTSGLQQKLEFPEGQPGLSLYPREIIEAEVPPGLYFLRVKVRSQNFSQPQDRLRLVTSGDYIQQIDTTPGETLLPPADLPSVITVGASDSPKSSAGVSKAKPELVFPSLVTLNNGENYKGSSNSAAIAAAAVVALKSVNPALTRDQLISLLNSGPAASKDLGQGLPLPLLQFYPTGPGCFQLARLPVIFPTVTQILRSGAVTVMTSMGPKIFTSEDPFRIVPGFRRYQQDDMLVATAQGLMVRPRSQQPVVTAWGYEIVQTPQGQSICGFDGRPTTGPGSSDGSSGDGGVMRLPNPSQVTR